MFREEATYFFLLVHRNRRVVACPTGLELPVDGLLGVKPNGVAATGAADVGIKESGSGSFDAEWAFLWTNRRLFDAAESGGLPLCFPVMAIINDQNLTESATNLSRTSTNYEQIVQPTLA